MTSHLRSLASGFSVSVFLLLLCPLAPSPVLGQEENLRQFDPSDVYFQAWLKIREAEKAEENEKFLDAFNHYEKAARLFDSVGVFHPEWKPHLVKDRQETTKKSLDEIRERALEEQAEKERKLDGIVLEGPGTPRKGAEQGIKPLTPAEERQLGALQQQIRALRAQLSNVTNERDANAAQLRRSLTRLESQRDQMARAPLAGQVAELNGQIEQLQQERQAMDQALRQSRKKHQDALAQLLTLKADRDAAMMRAAQMENNLNVQRNAANAVVRGLREQLTQMKALAAEKDRLLAQANIRNTELVQQVKESNAEIADLREERSELLKERDHMATLLQLNETDRVKLLIEQNQSLGQELNEARARLTEVAANNNRTAQELIAAKSQLAIAKAKIIQLNTNHHEQTERLAALEQRLRQAGEELAADGRDPAVNKNAREEILVLQGIIDRTLAVQKRRREAQELLIETVKRKAIEDPEVWGAIALLGDQQLELTPEEAKIVENRTIDGEFVFGEHATPETRRLAGSKLQQSIRVKSDLAKRAFSNGRFLVAREFFESILEESPGNVTTQINLGVVHLRNQDPPLAIQSFHDAITLKGATPLPYAQFMLGVAHYELGEYEQARTHFMDSLQTEPANAKAHVFMGSISGVLGQVTLAESHFNEAISIDPTLSEPFYNLSILRLREGKKQEGLILYRKALENGHQPDLELEAQFGSN